MKKEVVLSKVNPLFLKGIAHRGLHNKELTENSLGAFKNAVKHGVALELDVHLTTDNKLIVCHDHDLKRVTGKEGIIEELSVKEIQENYRLLDGEIIPTFQEVLNEVNEQVPMCVELKVYNKNYKPLAKQLKEELKNVKDKKNFILISFDPRSLLPFKKSGFIRSLLVSHTAKWTYKFKCFVESVDLDQELFEDKKIQKYHRKHLVNCWTIETKEQLEKIKDYIDTATFQYLEPKEVEEILNK